MPNRAFDTLLIEHFEKFKFAFSETTVGLFVKEDGTLIHPGEYGAYRETISKEFLRLLVPQNYGIGKGFLITGKDKISTECDIVIYDSDNTPLLQTGERQRFFPIETVSAVGEIKSTLTKQKFKEAINKLAKIKLFRLDIENPTFIKRYALTGQDFKPDFHVYDNIFSFLICKKLDFDLSNIAEEIDSIYDSDVKHFQKHNMILSIDDGIILYFYNDPKLGKQTLYYPHFTNRILKPRFLFPSIDKYVHLKTFAAYIFAGVSSTTLLFTNIGKYIGDISGGSVIDKT